jgi:hypothetical protein
MYPSTIWNEVEETQNKISGMGTTYKEARELYPSSQGHDDDASEIIDDE